MKPARNDERVSGRIVRQGETSEAERNRRNERVRAEKNLLKRH
jgi:hypothetical protein